MAKLLNKLKNDAWAVKTEAERVEILTEIEKNEAKKQGRAAREIKIESCPGLLGYYEEAKDKLVISDTAMSSAGLAICTTIHEGRHAYQFDVINNKVKNDKNDILWLKNWNGYLNPNTPGIGAIDYYMQPLEQDAWIYSIKGLKTIARKVNDINIKNDLTDIKSTFNIHKIKAQRLYGRKLNQVIQSKIDEVFTQKEDKPNSYSKVVEVLKKEGLHSERTFLDYIVPISQVEKTANTKIKEEKDRAKKQAEVKAAKIKSIAEKYGFSEEASKNAIQKIKENKKTQEKNKSSDKPQPTKSETSDKADKTTDSPKNTKINVQPNSTTTVKVSVTDHKQK